MSPVFRKSHIVLATVGAGMGVACLARLSHSVPSMVLLGSFGASALLLFALPEAPLSQPRAVIGGHFLASAIALVCLLLLGHAWWSLGLAAGLGVGVMMATRTVHPPAGSNSIIVFLAKPAASSLLLSTLGGTLLLVGLACCYHRLTGRHQYPRYVWKS